MLTAIQVKTATPEVADPKDVRAGIFAAIIAVLILFIILFLYTFEMLDPPPADVVVKTETTLEEIELKELVIEPGGGGATSPTDAAPSPTDAKQVLTGNSSTSTTQTDKTKSKSLFIGIPGPGKPGPGKPGPGEPGPGGPSDPPEKTCTSLAKNESEIIKMLENDPEIKKSIRKINNVIITIKSTGEISKISFDPLGASGAILEKKIRQYLFKLNFENCPTSKKSMTKKWQYIQIKG